jgi:adenylate cyclase class IV
MEQFNLETTELELKYKADDIKMSEFVTFAQALNPIERIEVGGWDTYYSGSGLPFEFIRHRQGSTPELTIKIKMDEKNNQSRIEVDLPLRVGISSNIVSKFCGLFGFKENFRIYKYCDIYIYEKLDIVFYIIYDQNKNEKGRFIEIEARKDAKFSDAEEAWRLVKEMEQSMSVLGISPANRMKRSLWEMFRKEKI